MIVLNISNNIWILNVLNVFLTGNHNRTSDRELANKKKYK